MKTVTGVRPWAKWSTIKALLFQALTPGCQAFTWACLGGTMTRGHDGGIGRKEKRVVMGGGEGGIRWRERKWERKRRGERERGRERERERERVIHSNRSCLICQNLPR